MRDVYTAGSFFTGISREQRFCAHFQFKPPFPRGKRRASCDSVRTQIQPATSPNSLTCREEFKFCMPSPEAIPPRVWLGSALFERGSFRLGEGKNGEVVGSSTRPPSWLEKERVSCVQCPGVGSAQNSFPWKYKRAWMSGKKKSKC